jgi:iron complex transport system substrate-binding protein
LGDRATPSLETLVEINPDLIVAETWHDYTVLSKIAPTLVLDNKVGKDGWSHRLQTIAQAFGKEEQAEQIIAEYERQLAEVREKLAPVVAAYPHVLTVGDWNNQNTFRILSSSLYRDHIAVLLEEIGFEMVLPDRLQGETSRILGNADISVETLIQLDPDIIIVSTNRPDNFYNSELIVKRKWEENPLLKKMRAVQGGRICFVSSKHLGNSIGGSIAYKSILDLLPKLLLPFVGEK